MSRKIDNHEWLEERHACEAALVMRLDNYGKTPIHRGQFVPAIPYPPDNTSTKAIWPSVDLAHEAAKWATKKFGHVYGVFKLVEIVEPAETPVRVTEIR